MSSRAAKDEFYNQVAAPWVKAGERCFKCGCWSDSLHCHHILTKGAYIVLMLCPWNLVPLCWLCHRFAHDFNKKFMAWLEGEIPGIKERLWQLAREWLKKPLGEIEEIYKTLPEWGKHWRVDMV